MKKAIAPLHLSPTRSASQVEVKRTFTLTKLISISAILIATFAAAVVVTTFFMPRAANAAACTSNGTGGGNWNTGTTWVGCTGGGGVPAATDTITIKNGDTVTINTMATVAGITVGEGTSGILEFEQTTAQTLTVNGNVTVAIGGTFRSNTGGSQTGHVLSLSGDLTNNGTIDFSTNGNTAAAGITFTGATNNNFSGTGGTTDIRAITINKGVSATNTLELTTTNFTVRGVTTDVAAFLTLTNGTFKLSGSFSGTNRVFAGPGYTIGATTGFFLNNANYTVAGQGGSLTLNGSLRVASGSYLIGTAAGNSLQFNTGASFTMDGGTLTITGRFQGASTTQTINFNMSGGTLTARTIGNSSNDLASFDLQATGSTFTMSGGTIALQNENGAGGGNAVDYRNRASTVTVTGGTVQFGNGSTSGSPSFEIAQTGNGTNTLPSLTINATGTPSVHLNTAITIRGDISIASGTTLDDSGNFAIAVSGNSVSAPGNWSNNNASGFTQGTSTVTFNGTNNQSIGGTASTTFSTLSIGNTGTSPNNVVSLAISTTVNTALNITSGLFSQGASAADDFSLTTNAVTVSSVATWQNLGRGDVTLSGNVANSGTINLNANGTSCGDADDILIRSTAGARTWSGTGTFSMSDVDVQNQTAGVPPTAIFVTSGINSGGNTGWVFLGSCTSGSYVWTGSISADWQVAANWSPVRTLPAAADVLIFDGTGTPSPTITNVPTQTLAALRLVNSINGVTLNAATTPAGTKTLTLSGVSGSDLSVPTGSLLTLAGATALEISVASGSTGTVGGQIIVQGGAHRVLGNAASAITFQSGALFTTSTGFTGNAFGSGTAGSIIFANGSSYIHNAGASPFGTGTAVVIFQTGSEARYLTATGFDADGRTYANLTIGKASPAGIIVNATQSGSGNFQFDNLVINSPDGGSSSTLEYVGSGSSVVTIAGNITSIGTIAGTAPDVFLTGGSNIVINGGSAVSWGNATGNTRSIFFGSNATVNSGTNLHLSRLLQMGLSGTNILTDNGTITPNFLATGYVVGGVRKPTVPASYTFPVGTTGGYTPVNLANASGGGDLTVTPKPTVAPVVNASTSLQEHWSLNLNSGALTTDLTFNYLQSDVQGTEASYRVIRVSGGTAVSMPNNCPTPTVETACVDFVNNKATVPGVNSFSDWTLGQNLAPTAVRLTGFTATTRDDGVMLEWKSGFEVNNLGYHLYRYQDGQRKRLTPSLIAGSSLIRKGGGELASGFSYGWFDSQGTLGSQYQLEAIDLGGDVQTFAPRYEAKSGSHGDPKKDRARMLSEVSSTGAGEIVQRGWVSGADNGRDMRTAAANSQSLTTQQSIAGQQAVKIRVNQTGWYRVTKPQLVAAGLDPAADARKLQLYVDGVEVPIRVSTNQSRLAETDTVEFYGLALDALTTDTHVYYLINGTRNGLRIATVADKPAGKGKADTPAPSFRYTVESKERFLYVPGVLNGDSDNIFGQLVRSDPATQTVTLKNIDVTSNAPAQLEVVLQGFTQVAHAIQVQLNGSYLGTINFSGTEHKSSILSVTPALLKEGDNTVVLTGSGGDADASLVDALRITYARTYQAENDTLSFSVGDRPAVVGGFGSPAIRVIDITNPSVPREVTPKITQTGGSYGFTISATGAGQNLLAFVDSLARMPASIVQNQPSNWNAGTNAADMLIIPHDDFRSSADTLATARRAEGMKVSVVDVEDLYDEFSFGAHTPQALKDFFARANSVWAIAPKYVLLFGDSSWDPRNYLGQGYNDFVPSKLVESFELETTSDDWLADFDADGIPELAVGRLPARTSAEASTMVSKILNYDQERASGSPLRGALLVSDNGFESQTAQVQSFLAPLTTVQTLSRSAIGNDNIMRNQIVDAINQGPTIVNYFGHGSVTVWTGAGLLNEENGNTLTNASRPSLFVMMTCLNGYAGDAYIDSLAEVVLKNPQGGGFAAWASSGITDPVGQAQMNGQLYQSLLGDQPMRLGDAVRQAKMSTVDKDVRRTWILLGDPSMRLK